MGLGIPPLIIDNYLLESNPLKSRIVIRRLASHRHLRAPLALLRSPVLADRFLLRQDSSKGVQWKQGVVMYMIYAGLLYNTTPIHCTPLPLHPPVMNTHCRPSRSRCVWQTMKPGSSTRGSTPSVFYLSGRFVPREREVKSSNSLNQGSRAVSIRTLRVLGGVMSFMPFCAHVSVVRIPRLADTVASDLQLWHRRRLIVAARTPTLGKREPQSLVITYAGGSARRLAGARAHGRAYASAHACANARAHDHARAHARAHAGARGPSELKSNGFWLLCCSNGIPVDE